VFDSASPSSLTPSASPFVTATRKRWCYLDPLLRFSPLPRLRTVSLVEGVTHPQVKVKMSGTPSRAPDESLITQLPDVIAQMFEWDWDSVASECTNFLGPAGYGFVQGESNGLRIFPRLHC